MDEHVRDTDLLKEASRRMDRSETFERAPFMRLAELGLTALTIPERYGGSGFYESKQANLAACVALEEINRVCASTGVTLSVHMSLFCGLLAKWGTDEQKERVLPKLASGEWIGAYCLSEAGAGTDAGALTCAARRDGDDYALDGPQLWLASAP
ncbi:MAG: acyl-CoA dehydrogenase family protein, partial [Planctomycetes bacterium]|nr:acyl-CoA dehydrogenase family protein [Planctomycetota bacterium]